MCVGFEVKINFNQEQDEKAWRGSRGIALLFLYLWRWMEMGGQRSCPGRFDLGKETHYPLCRRLNGPQGRSGRLRKTSTPQGFDPLTAQPVASHYTDYAILSRRSSSKVAVILTDLHQTWIWSTDFNKIFQYQMQWKSVQLETSCSAEADKQTFTTTELDPHFFLIGENVTFGHWMYLCVSYSSHGEHRLFPPNTSSANW